MKQKLQNEPVMTAGVITAIITAVITLLAAFGLDMTAEQQAAIIALAAIIIPIAANYLARAKVTPVHKLNPPRD
jgi:hypothetical protein